MLRALVAVLLVANLAFWAWSAGLMDNLGLGPSRERDPLRLTQQIHPEAVRVLPSAAAVAATRSAAPRASAVADEKEGQPIAGEAGKLLVNMLAAVSLSSDSNAYITNLVKCRPTTANGGDRSESC